MHTIQSEHLRVCVNPIGAELFNLTSRKTNREYLWQGDPTWWGSRAPVLFPILCGMRGNAYTYKGKPYTMTKHGFVRYEEFAVVDKSESRITFEYTDNEKTREMYPFAFVFRVMFGVEGNTLTTEYRVENKSGETMYFSTGAHEAFNVMHEASETFEDYYLEFDTDADYHSEIITPEGLIDGKTYPVLLNGRILPLMHNMFDNDAVVFRNVASKRVFLKSKKSTAFIEYDYQDAPNVGFWQKPGAPYICIEPWFGLPDEASHNGKIEEKYGIIPLEASGTWAWAHNIIIHEE
ncbi:MAG: aldose 1-epimerase family protein [Defluviitaleaceae bacterium]|nr:aldose 1-epimerase family protein [Defluviitaleaceae bacterium]MCL2275985.1 aldose 1-epimerase family protein [Defluviitaleaceae bacterium]